MNGSVFTTILRGVPVTLLLTFVALAIGVVGGFPLLIARQSPVRALRVVARLVTELLRGIPPIVWLFIIYFGLGTKLPALDATTAAIIGLGVVSCAYMAEIYRGGLTAVHLGQWDAARALGMSRRTTAVRVIGPQVLRISVPATATYAIGLLKDSSVAYTIGVTEIVFWANAQSHSSADAIGPFLVATALYVVVTIPCAWGARSLDAKLRRRVAR